VEEFKTVYYGNLVRKPIYPGHMIIFELFNENQERLPFPSIGWYCFENVVLPNFTSCILDYLGQHHHNMLSAWSCRSVDKAVELMNLLRGWKIGDGAVRGRFVQQITINENNKNSIILICLIDILGGSASLTTNISSIFIPG